MSATPVRDGQLNINGRYDLVPLDHLFVDYHEDVLNGDGLPEHSKALAYQRRQDRIAKKIVAAGVNPDLFGVLVVNTRSNGTFAVVDGGTRYRALKQLDDLPPDTLVPCLVFTWDGHREVQNYVALNKERSGLTQVDIFVAQVKYGDPVATAIDQILIEETGHGVGYRKGHWQCVDALKIAHRNQTLRNLLILMRQLGWLDEPGGKTQNFVGALNRLLTRKVDPERALKVWRGLSVGYILTEARKLHYGSGASRKVAQAVAFVLADPYNKRLSLGKRISVLDLQGDNGNDDDDD